MKLQIDTAAKTIKLEQSAKITEILSVVKKLFPNDEWKEYTLEAVTVINNWTNPIIIDRWPQYPYPLTPIYGVPNTVCDGIGSISVSENGGTLTNFVIN